MDVNKKQIVELLRWMESHLAYDKEFSADDLRKFFAEKFVIQTNGRLVNATLDTYREYLYELKQKLHKVTYETEEAIVSENKVVIPFIITLELRDKEPCALRAISIFTLDEASRITRWDEVFTDAKANSGFAYD